MALLPRRYQFQFYVLLRALLNEDWPPLGLVLGKDLGIEVRIGFQRLPRIHLVVAGRDSAQGEVAVGVGRSGAEEVGTFPTQF